MATAARPHRALERVARRWSRPGADAEDLLQESLLDAVAAGRGDMQVGANRRWVAGVIRNKARFWGRSRARRALREEQWGESQDERDVEHDRSSATSLTALPPALRVLALLALSGLGGKEIRHLLGLTDATFRKRVSALRKRLATLADSLPPACSGLTLDLAYGRIRSALLPVLERRQGHFASHDPDGHLFVVRRS